MPPALLLFDLGGVLVRNAGFDRLNALLPSPIDTDALKGRLLASPAYRAFELGRSTPEVFARSMVDEFALRCTPESFLAEFPGWPLGFYPGAEDLLAALRRRYRLACLSNSNALHWERFGGFAGHFDVALSSHLLGAIKPDRDCFEKALQACSATADDVLFFDDAIVNVEAARACGIQSLHVRDFDDLAARVDMLRLLR